MAAAASRRSLAYVGRGAAGEGRKVLALTLVLKHASGLDEAARATLTAAAGAPPASGPRSQRARPVP